MRLETIGLALLVAVSIAAPPLFAEAQPAEQVRRIGLLVEATPSRANVDAFRQALRDNGYVEGRNLLVERRSAEGHPERLPGLATELTRLGIEVLVTEGPAAALAAKNTTASTPIVFTFAVDPVALGLVASLARPGGNTTGVANVTVELTGKRLELLKEAIPSLRSVALLTNPANPASVLSITEARIAARWDWTSASSRCVMPPSSTPLSPRLLTSVPRPSPWYRARGSSRTECRSPNSRRNAVCR